MYLCTYVFAVHMYLCTHSTHVRMHICIYVHYNKVVIIVHVCHQYCVDYCPTRLGNNRGNHDNFSNDNRIVSDFDFVLIVIS